MSKSQSTPKNRPRKEPFPLSVYLPGLSNVGSAGECTGLIPRPPADEGEERSYRQLSPTEAEENN